MKFDKNGWVIQSVHTHSGTPVADDVIYGHLVDGHALIASSKATAEIMHRTHRDAHAGLPDARFSASATPKTMEDK